ncbi:unnamed protein product [Urochloa humidicola]
MGDTPITQESLDATLEKAIDEAMEKVFGKITELAKKMDLEFGNVRLEQSRLSTSINNVQTQVLASKGRFDSSSSSAGGDGGRPPLAPPAHKLRYQKYDGSEDPLDWLHKGEQFFRAHETPEDLKVWTASYYLKGAASQWYYRFEKNKGAVPTWPEFVDAVNKRFGPPVRSNPLGELTHWHRTGSVEEYQEQFLRLLARCSDVTERQQIDIFTAGLLPPMSIDVEMQKPDTLEDAMALARSYERRNQIVDDASRPAGRPSRVTPRSGTLPTSSFKTPATTTTGSSPQTPGAPVKGAPPAGRFTRLSPEEMAQRRLDGLCYNCPEKFSREHIKQCSMKGIYFLEVEEDTDASSDSTEEEVRISLNAITGVQSGSTIQLATVVNGTALAALVDSGSTHSFISEDTARRIGLTPAPRPGLTVGVANGDRILSSGVCKDVTVHIGQEQFIIDLFVIPLGGYELVLGCEWLKTLGPILWDFNRLTMTFWHLNRRVKWFGINAKPQPRLSLTDTLDVLGLLLQEFADLFATPTGLPPPRPFDHRIHLLPDTPPVAVRPYRYPQLLKDEIEKQCKTMLEQGIIRASTSAFSSPVLLVRKSDGTWRFCVDYRALNAKTVRDLFPIPVVEELLDELKGAIFFTKLDLRSGYHQVRMHVDDIHKTAFRTHHGHFEFLVMPFGLTNAPSTFQALMNEVLKPFLRRCVLVFFDDILIYSRSWAEHIQHVRAVFTVLREHGLVLKQSKCSFGEQQVRYLGHVITNDAVAMDTEKIAAVQAWPQPRSVRALRGFLGLTSYYRRFIHNYGVIAAPLTALLKREAFRWSAEATAAFEALKHALTTGPVLQLPNFEQPFVVDCDASGSGFGAVLHQEQGPIAFFSKQVAPQHAKLAAYERELIGLVHAVRHWRPYLWAREFIVRTDHCSLKHLLDQRLSTIPQHTWVSKLFGYHFQVEYKPGKQNAAADALSRRDEHEPGMRAHAISRPEFQLFDEFRREAESLPEVVAKRQEITEGTAGAAWSVVDGLVMHQGRIFIPTSSSLWPQVLDAAHGAGHEGVQKTLHRLRASFYSPHASKLVREFVKGCMVCQRNKTEHLHPAGLLQPLDVPSSIWSDIAMDFVEGFPKVGGRSVVLTVVDRFSKMAHFVPLGHPYTALSVAQAFFDNIVKLHGLPCSIVSDRDPVFTSALWTELFKLSGVQLRLSSAFRPQTDGQSEVTNRVLGVYLRCLAGDRPRSWLRWLPWAEFCYNTSYQSSLQTTPFKVVFGRDPPALLSYEAGAARVAAVDKQLLHRDEFLAEIRERLLQAQDYMKASHDKSHRELEFSVGEWAWLRLHNRSAVAIKDKSSSKLAPRYYGPFLVTEKIGAVAYRLRLPPKARIHDVFHVVFLKKFEGSAPASITPLPPLVHGRAVPVPAKVVRAKPAGNSWDVLVQWEGRSTADASWLELQTFKETYPDFKLEDELFCQEGGSVMDSFGKQYRRQNKKKEDTASGSS